MRAERWLKIQELYHRCLELEDEFERTQLLETLAANNEELQHEVLALLRESHALASNGMSSTTEVSGDRSGEWFGEFELLEKLGSGGTADVYVARQASMRRIVALKIVREDVPLTDEVSDAEGHNRFRARFQMESEVLSRLNHPGVVPVHFIGKDELGRHYFSMQLLEGSSFHQVRRQENGSTETWSLPRVLGTILKVCDTMSYAHERGVIHRDLKPAHIILGRHGQVHVVDWGLAKIVSGPAREGIRAQYEEIDCPEPLHENKKSDFLTQYGEIVGTPAYMPPEQAAGEHDLVGSRSDIYSLGAVLHFGLVGYPPHLRENEVDTSPEATLERILDQEQDPCRDLEEVAPPELVAICRKAMAYHVEDRYQEMSEFAKDLRSFLDVRVVKAYHSGPFAELVKWCARNQLAAVLIAAVPILIVMGLAIWDWRWRMEKPVSDFAKFHFLEENFLEIGPATPENLPRIRAWLSECRLLEEQLSEYESRLNELKNQALVDRHGRSGLVRRELEKEIESSVHVLRSDYSEAWHKLCQAQSGRITLDRRDIDRLKEVLEEKSAEIVRLDAASRRVSQYDFESPKEKLRFDALRFLVDRAKKITDRDTGYFAMVARKEKLATRLKEGGEFYSTWRTRWLDARRAISESEKYGLLDIEPQVGLMPIGANPATGLWEFEHLESADFESPTWSTPTISPDKDDIQIARHNGIVLVLMPGGSLFVGAQSDDVSIPNFDPLAHRREWLHQASEPAPMAQYRHQLTLQPYFMSKYEMTQEQWHRLTNSRPSYYQSKFERGALQYLGMHPVTQVSHRHGLAVLKNVGLTFPTEAQWEFAAKGGAQEYQPWFTGEDALSMQGYVNLADKAAEEAFASWLGVDSRFNDGFVTHTAVDDLKPNAYGIYSLIGNVWEWCLDGYGNYWQHSWEAGTGEVNAALARHRTRRGGGFRSPPIFCRTAHRQGDHPDFLDNDLGIRPARALDV